MLEPNYLFSLGTITLFLVSVTYFHCLHSSILFAAICKGKINCSRGVPVIRMRNSRIRTVDERLIPSPSEALQLYRSAGGTITDSHEFGIDPLSSPKQLMRQKAFNDSFRLDDVFHTLVNRDDTGFRRAVLFFIDITYRLSL